MLSEKKLTHLCPRCNEERWIEEFRVCVPKTGARYAYCHDCEAEYDKERRGPPAPVEVPLREAAMLKVWR